MPMLLRAFIAAVFSFWFTAVSAAERITDYTAAIAVQTNGDLLVTERIGVVAEGNAIKRGIYRDFPTVRGRTWWGKYRTGFNVVSVTRNGENEPHFTESITDGVRLYTGSADVFLEEGPHTYEITYRSDRQIGFFDDHDELYWNVTGNFWAFPIAKVSAVVTLPEGAEVTETDVFTGPLGATGKDATISAQGTVVTARTTKPLERGEGLTIGISFTPNLIARPGFAERAVYLLRDNLGSVLALAGLALLLGYYMGMWSKYGRDPAEGTIAPEYAPPKGLSAAACRYVRDMGWDAKAFTASIIALGAKGYLKMSEVEGGLLKEGHFTVTRTGSSEKDAGLSDSETQMARALFKNADTVAFKTDQYKIVVAAQNTLRESLQREFDSVYFVLNRGTLIPGFALSVLTAGAVAWAADDPAVFGFGIVAVAVLAMAITGYIVRLLRGLAIAVSIIKRIIRLLPLIIVGGMAVLLKPGEIIGDLLAGADIIALAAIALMGVANVVFAYLMEAPTQLGRSMMTHIAGFQHYLSVAEKDRLNFHNPPDLTPEVFEAMLPYAVALDVEHEWGEQFDAAMARVAAAGQTTAYSKPRWYDGPSFSPGRMSSFGSHLQNAVASSVATAVTPPSSGKGGGGGFKSGGFSGGGGGGGGGGGW
ncbi:MAG: DUF2207 domain-containing protein [Rhodospirillaceae bacterium]|nr:DUF2207 domain-containing protein [Rhodospirillaceae bacterium]